MFVGSGRRRFSVDRRKDEHRIHFSRIRRNTKKMSKPLWWLMILLLAVLAIIYYLTILMR